MRWPLYPARFKGVLNIYYISKTLSFPHLTERARSVKASAACERVQRPCLWRGVWGWRKSPKHQKRLSRRGLNRFVYFGGSSRDQLLLRCFRFVFLKGWRDDDCLLRIGAVNRLAVMPKRSLGKPFRHSDNLCPLRPCVAVAVQRHARHARPFASAAKPACPVVGGKRGQLRE